MNNKKFSNRYNRITTKTPAFFILFIFVGISLFLYLALKTKVDVTQTYRGNITKSGSIYELKTDTNITLFKNSGFIYINKNAKMIKVSIKEKSFDIYILTANRAMDLSIFTGQKVNVEVPYKSVSLLKKVFLQGGKNS
ncbi:MAG TPA: hypothetical protein VIK86_07160 [Candidatus Paceibacterota bacterium]